MAAKKIRNPKSEIRIGVDTGGTFTDFIYADGAGKLKLFKLPSTPDDPARAILTGLERIARETGAQLNELEIIHGTTVGTNALLERKGARVALVTTAGFEDVIEIGRQTRPALYDLNAVKPAPLVPSELRFGARERIAADGSVLTELTDKDITALVKKVKAARPEAIALCLLFAFANPAHEQKLKNALETLGLPLSVAHEILPEYREYERTSTVVINAYLQPVMGRYLSSLTQANSSNPKQTKNSLQLRVMQSSGGSISAAVAIREPVRTVLSGPAGGVVGSLRVARAAGISDIVTFDMGGTSTDVALCAGGAIRLTTEAHLAGVPVAVPMMDMQTVGAGGGSIAYVDAGSSLRVGPRSAGALPGPACYARSDELLPTVTDANCVLNRFGGAGLLGGEFQLDAERARSSLAPVAQAMSDAAGRKISVVETALGILRVVNSNMERALRLVSVERGYDPRNFALVPFGGAGGLHAVELARGLKIPRVVVPNAPGALSALGCLVADVVKDFSQTVMLALKDNSPNQPALKSKLEKTFRRLETEARRVLRQEGFAPARQKLERSLAVRYQGQSFDLDIAFAVQNTNIAAAFHTAHETRYGYARPASSLEIVSARLRAIGLPDELNSAQAQPKSRLLRVVAVKPHDFAKVHFAAKPTRAALYRREDLTPGATLQTPCIITEYSATTLVLPDVKKVSLDANENIVIEL